MIDFFLSKEEEMRVVFCSKRTISSCIMGGIAYSLLLLIPYDIIYGDDFLEIMNGVFMSLLPLMLSRGMGIVIYKDVKKMVYFTTQKIVIAYPRWYEKNLDGYSQQSFHYDDISYCWVKKSKKIRISVKTKDFALGYDGSEKKCRKDLFNLTTYTINFRRNEFLHFKEVLNILLERARLSKHPHLEKIYYTN